MFDGFYESYSYLEDLDLSYSIGQVGRLAVVSDAGFYHFPSLAGRISARRFGRYEVRNRLYFVRKHELSIARCYVGLAIRLAMSLLRGLTSVDSVYLSRATGNIAEIVQGGSSLSNPAKKEA